MVGIYYPTLKVEISLVYKPQNLLISPINMSYNFNISSQEVEEKIRQKPLFFELPNQPPFSFFSNTWQLIQPSPKKIAFTIHNNFQQHLWQLSFPHREDYEGTFSPYHDQPSTISSPLPQMTTPPNNNTNFNSFSFQQPTFSNNANILSREALKAIIANLQLK